MDSVSAIQSLPPGLTETRHTTAVETRRSPAALAEFTRLLAVHDEAAFREFHARYFDRLYQFLLVVAHGQEHEAQEALQETLLRVARHARAFDDEERFWCWLKAVARNAARDGGRKRGRYRALLKRFSLFCHGESEAGGLAETQMESSLSETLAELPLDERQLVEGKYLDGQSVRDLAAQYGLTEKAVESKLLRLRRHLRNRLLEKLKER